MELEDQRCYKSKTTAVINQDAVVSSSVENHLKIKRYFLSFQYQKNIGIGNAYKIVTIGS